MIDHGYTIAMELRKHVDLRVYIIAKQFSEEIRNFCEHLNAVFFRRARFRNPVSLLRELIFLNAVRRQKPDVVWFELFSVYQALFARLFVKNYLVTVHDVELHPEEKDVYSICARWLTLRFHRERVCTASKTQAEVFERRFGKTPKVLQLPIKDYYEKCAGKGERQGGKPPCSKGYVKFFFFGKIRPYKGIEVLLKAAELVRDSGLDFRLNIYGKIAYSQAKILKQVEALPEVNIINEFIDYREVYSIFEENDIIILPYVQVTQCGPMLIAYNQNIPVICTDLPGFREYVDDEKSGLLFAGGAENLAEKMKVVLENPAMVGEMSEYIKGNIKPRFGMESLGKEYLKNFGKTK
jgi:glycosyltransferase involved in cell wall biosynthesis